MVPAKGMARSAGLDIDKSDTFPAFISMKMRNIGSIHVMKNTPSVAPARVEAGRITMPVRVMVIIMPIVGTRSGDRMPLRIWAAVRSFLFPLGGVGAEGLGSVIRFGEL